MNDTQKVTCSPRPAHGGTKCLVIILSVLAVVGFALSALLGEYAGIVQLFCALAIVYALYVASRFLFVSYTYSLFTNEKGKTFFLIEEKQGKRASLVCQLPLHRIYSIKPQADAKAETKGRYYTYVASMWGGDYYVVAARGETGRAGIKIEPDEAFLSAFRAALAEATEEE